MLVKKLWEDYILDYAFPSKVDYLAVIVFTLPILLVDILLLPFEIIALIIYRIREGEWYDE